MIKETNEQPVPFDPNEGYNTIDIPSYLKQLRKDHKLSQRAVSARAGFPNSSTVASIERRAIRNPGIFTTGAIAESFGMTLSEFIEQAERFTRDRKDV